MALDEVTFINILGEEISITNIVNQMIDYYQQKLEVGETAITDFNEGSEIRNILEAVSVLGFSVLEAENEAGKLPFISSSYAEWLDRIGENPHIDLPRITGDYSVGSVTFTLTDAQSSDYIIPAQTLLTDSVNDLDFVTDSDCTIYAGETTADVDATCLTIGYDGNIAKDTLTIISDTSIDSGLVSVNNNYEFTGGADYEDDEDYRTRLLDNVRAEPFGSKPYYLNLGANISGVHDVLLKTVTGYTGSVVVNGYDKPVSDATLLDVLAVFSDVEKVILNHSFTVERPTYVTLDLTLDFNVTTEIPTNDLTDLLTQAVNGGSFNQIIFDGLNIGDNLTSSLIYSSFELLDDVVSVVAYETGESSEFVSTDVSTYEVVKIGDLTINQTVV